MMENQKRGNKNCCGYYGHVCFFGRHGRGPSVTNFNYSTDPIGWEILVLSQSLVAGEMHVLSGYLESHNNLTFKLILFCACMCDT